MKRFIKANTTYEHRGYTIHYGDVITVWKNGKQVGGFFDSDEEAEDYIDELLEDDEPYEAKPQQSTYYAVCRIDNRTAINNRNKMWLQSDKKFRYTDTTDMYFRTREAAEAVRRKYQKRDGDFYTYYVEPITK